MDIEQQPLHWVNRLAVLSKRSLTRKFQIAGHNVSPEEWAILLLLWREDAQSPGDMSARTVRDPTTMTRLIDGMVNKGMVERRADASDRRRSRICLTNLGKELEKKLVPLAGPTLIDAQRGIDQEDVATALKVLRVMCANLDGGDGKLKGKE